MVLFTSKIVTKLSKIWVWDHGSRSANNLFWIPNPGVKKAPDPGSLRIRNTGRRIRREGGWIIPVEFRYILTNFESGFVLIFI
jgi:hypothetical protein